MLFKGDEVDERLLLPKSLLQVKADTYRSSENGKTLLTGNVQITSTSSKAASKITVFVDPVTRRITSTSSKVSFPIAADKAQVETALVEAQLELGDSHEFVRESVAELLLKLKAAPGVPRFRIKWQTSAASYVATTTISFDREQKKLTYWSTGGQGTGSRRKLFNEHTLYTGVATDEKAVGIFLNLFGLEKLPIGVTPHKRN